MAHACDDCDREFDTEHGLATHRGLVHGGSDTTTTCDHCGAALNRGPARLERADAHYCDHDCRAAELRTGREIDCEWCGDTVYKSQRDLDDNDHNFCTKSCYSAYKRAHTPADFQLESARGYPYWRISSNSRVAVHQLVVIAEGTDPHKVFDDQYNVHHANGCEFDNRPENIELLDVTEHGRRDGGKRVKQYTQMDLLHVINFFLTGPLATD
jgi:ribosomal protein S27E